LQPKKRLSRSPNLAHADFHTQSPTRGPAQQDARHEWFAFTFRP